MQFSGDNGENFNKASTIVNRNFPKRLCRSILSIEFSQLNRLEATLALTSTLTKWARKAENTRIMHWVGGFYFELDEMQSVTTKVPIVNLTENLRLISHDYNLIRIQLLCEIDHHNYLVIVRVVASLTLTRIFRLIFLHNFIQKESFIRYP